MREIKYFVNRLEILASCAKKWAGVLLILATGLEGRWEILGTVLSNDVGTRATISTVRSYF